MNGKKKLVLKVIEVHLIETLKVLEFYADDKNWHCNGLDFNPDSENNICIYCDDRGKKAREILGKLK